MPRKHFIIVDHRHFFDVFQKESDRACAILGRALLDDQLRQLFEASFVADTDTKRVLESTSPLATFSARIRVSEALGWLSDEVIADLDCIREIGNLFAHHIDYELSFEEQSVRDKVFALRLPRILIEYDSVSDEPITEEERETFSTVPRRRFEVTVGLICFELTQEIQRRTRPQAPFGLLAQLDEMKSQGRLSSV